MANPRHRDEQRGSGQADGRAGMSVAPIVRDDPEIPPQRWCEFTLAFCRCWPVIESPTMISCQRHFLGELDE